MAVCRTIRSRYRVAYRCHGLSDSLSFDGIHHEESVKIMKTMTAFDSYAIIVGTG